MRIFLSQVFRAGAITALALYLTGCAAPDDAAPAKTLEMIQQWVHGYYNNLAQAEADMAAELPAELSHRPMHQLFVPVQIAGIDGYLLYQHSSLDGSENPAMIFRHGLMQYLPDAESGMVRQRELYFGDPEKFKNAHRNPEVLANLLPDDLTWDENCDFHLQLNDDQTMISGPIPEGQCVLFNEGLQQDMFADDWLEITSDSYSFRGRYVDADGKVLWGTESDELNRLTRQPVPAPEPEQ